MKRSWRLVATSTIALLVASASVISSESPARAAVVDRVVCRFADPESVGADSMRFVMMRELIVEAWLVAFERVPSGRPSSFDDKQLRAALERHVIEQVLSDRLTESSATKEAIAKGEGEARMALTITLGDGRLAEVLTVAGGGVAGSGAPELAAILKRRARAELYLELAVAQPVTLTEGDLRAAHAKAPPSLAKKPFEDAVPELRIHLRSLRLREASQAYYQAVRGRVKLEIVSS